VPASATFEALSALVVSDNSLESVMTAIAEVAKKLLPAAAEVSVTLIRDSVAETVASTGALASLMDERQYDNGAGPCLTAATTGRLIAVHDATTVEQWPQFAAGARQHGVGSSLSVPVRLPEPIAAALNVYSVEREGFTEQEVELARTLAAYAAVALANLHLYESQKRVAEHLEKALASRATIDQAKGILMAQRRCGPDEAFTILVTLSQQSNRKLRDVAAALVESTTTGP
jgi:GAF domain-containing protein